MTATGGPGGGDAPDIFGPHERPRVLRGVLLLAAAVVIGALLMPSATRPALHTTAAVSPSTSSPTTIPAHSSGSTTTSAPPTASAIHVLVANGTDTNGAATAVSSFLSGKGFSMLTPVSALTVVSASQVYAIGGAVSAAQQVAQALGLSASSIEPAAVPVPVSTTTGANVVVVVGPDLESRS